MWEVSEAGMHMTGVDVTDGVSALNPPPHCVLGQPGTPVFLLILSGESN